MAHVTKPVDESQALVKGLESALPELKCLAPKYVNLQRLLALALEAKLRNPLLAKTSLASVVAFCKRCAEWGTDRVGAGGVWPVPFWNKTTGTYDMVPIPDWRLLIAKAIKAKAITHAAAEAVYEHDEFSYERGLNPALLHRPKIGDRGALKAVYCVYTLLDGTKDFVVMSYQEDVIPIRDRTNAWRSWVKDKRENPWVTHPEEQSKKTVVKRAMKLFEGASIELTALLEADNAVMGYTDLTPPEPIRMPALVEATTTSTEPIDGKAAPATTTEAASEQPAAITHLPTTWTKGRDSRGKAIPHPYAGAAIADLPVDALTTIIEGLRNDPAIPSVSKQDKDKLLLDVMESELERRIAGHTGPKGMGHIRARTEEVPHD